MDTSDTRIDRPAALETASRLVLRVGNLIDDPSGEPVRDRVLVIEGGDVVQISEPGAVSAPLDRAVEIDLSDGTVLPGLIDAHVHAVFSASAVPLREALNESDDELLARGKKNSCELLSSGILSVRDCGAPRRAGFALREALERSASPHPGLMVTGRPITVTGGHFFWCGEQADTKRELQRSVRRLAKEGADWIKIMASGGFMTPGSRPARRAYPVSRLAAAVKEAHRLGLRVAAHCLARESIVDALEAKVDTIEHCMFLVPNDSDGGNVHFVLDSEILRRVADIGTYVVPTLSAKYRSLDSKRRRKNHDPTVIRQLELEDARFAAFREMVGLGVRVIAGTDCGVSDTPFSSLSLELKLMADNGMSPSAVLCAATADSSDALGIPDAGRIARGKPADLIAVEGDPLTGISVLAQPTLIMKDGRIVYLDSNIGRKVVRGE